MDGNDSNLISLNMNPDLISAQRMLSSVGVDAQADLILRLVHSFLLVLSCRSSNVLFTDLLQCFDDRNNNNNNNNNNK